MITFYDIHSTTPNKSWSSWTWRVRYILNYKNLPYKTEYIEYPDIEDHSKKLGIPPTTNRPDGSPFYTLPAIYDSTTGKAVADSFLIAQYLDAAYPDTPTVVVRDMEVLTVAFADTFAEKFDPLYACLLRHVRAILSPRATEYTLRRPYFGKSWEELMALTMKDQMEGLEKVKEALGVIDGWYKHACGERVFILGDKPTFADFAAASMFIGIRTLFREECEVWKEIMGWHEGRWAMLLGGLKEWEAVM